MTKFDEKICSIGSGHCGDSSQVFTLPFPDKYNFFVTQFDEKIYLPNWFKLEYYMVVY